MLIIILYESWLNQSSSIAGAVAKDNTAEVINITDTEEECPTISNMAEECQDFPENVY